MLWDDIYMTDVKCHHCNRPAVLVDDNWVCHHCRVFISKKMEIWSRPVGYLRPISNYNPGKQQEYNDRKKYKITIE